jgi:hypothetical protein
MRNVPDKRRGNPNIHFRFSNFFFFFFFEYGAVYEIMWKYVLGWGIPQMRMWRMRIACWKPRAINIHSGCIILNCFSIVTVVAKTRLSVTFIRTLSVLLNLHFNFVSFCHVFLMRLSFEVFQPKSCMNSPSSTYVGLIYFPTWDFLVCLFVFLALQPIVVVFSQPGSGL